jgi:glycosyltransferase involved in cell wall biosynthesis
MKKVLIIHHSGYIGGAGVSLFHIAMALKSMPDKYEVEVYCPSNPPYICNCLKENGIKTIKTDSPPVLFNHYNGCNKIAFGRFSLMNIRDVFIKKKGWQEIKNVIEVSKPDVVAVNSMTLCWMGALIKKMGIKVICFHRETYAKGMFGIRTSYIKRCLKKDFDGVAFISNNDLKETGQIKGVAKVITDKVDVSLYEQVDKIKLRKDLNLNNQTFYIAYLGGVSKLKGAHVIIKALAHIKDRNINLLFLNFNSEKRLKTINDCKTVYQKLKFIFGLDYEAYILKLIDKYYLWDKIKFYPAVTNPERYIMAADIIVFPSTEAHQARPIYEAGISKRPIIITEFKQTTEFAINGFNCLTFNNGNYVELAEKICILEKNRELYNILVENNYRISLKNHNFSMLSKELDTFLSNI